MTINQLFSHKPPRDLVIKMLKLVGISNFENKSSIFSKQDICINTETSKNEWNKIFKELKKYYLECKYKKYCNEITKNKIVNVIRQCLKIYSMSIEGKEKYIKGKKVLHYSIINIECKTNITPKKCVVVFD